MEIRVIAVDWSGKKKGAAEAIWLAEARDGQIIHLENGLSPIDVLANLTAIAEMEPRTIVGLDFAFSMPAWYIESHFATNAQGFWEIVKREGESWLGTCPSPFFGLKGSSRSTSELLRKTERAALGAKSVFQISGPGAVGTGSIRGMPLLLDLRRAGWTVWPFDPPSYPVVVEIYPRLLAGPVVKTVWKQRIAYLERHFPNLSPRFTERAAGSEDAFDAAISALVMDQHINELNAVPDLSDDPIYGLEGRIWSPNSFG